jgi:hypothetical protein
MVAAWVSTMSMDPPHAQLAGWIGRKEGIAWYAIDA